MKKEIIFLVVIGLTIGIGAGCAPNMVSTSDPAIQFVTNPNYEIQFEPLKQGLRSFVAFRLTVTNKTKNQLRIDWNKTRYLFNGRQRGLYVFRGIDPDAVKQQTIAPDIIAPQDVFTKIIAPQKLIAYVPIRDQHKLDLGKSAISGGPVPAGENGILLVIRMNGEQITERLTVDITEVESEEL
jgi:hypothetical protein